MILITKIVIVQNGNQKIEKFNLFLVIMLFFMDESYDSWGKWATVVINSLLDWF